MTIVLKQEEQMKDIKVLCAEDHLKTKELYKEILENLFENITCASDGEEAKNLFLKNSFDIIITDINMPKLNGLELAKFVKQNHEDCAIIITSAYSDFEILSEVIDLGVDGYFLKPIDSQKFIDKLLSIANKIQISKKSRHYEALLREYKDAIDQSSIVSKTDTKGIITYVNDSFCKISGYTPEELLKKPHNIIRHPDMPSSAFKDMWSSLKSKKPWNGVVKNLKKDGGFYYVNAHVVPILNENDEVEEYIAIRHDITELESYKRNLEDKLMKSTKEIVNTQKEIIQTMGQVAEKRSMETGAHVKRVATYSYMLARLIGLNEDEAKLLEQASPMHDIGKVAIPDQILNKKGPLTEDERKEMQTHTAVGYELLKHSKRELLQTAAIVAHEHHEFWNGLGYPRRLKGEEIHIYGRITAIADVYDALGHDRVYKKAWPIEKIISYFQDELGEQFDPKLTEIFLKNIDYFEATRKNFEK